MRRGGAKMKLMLYYKILKEANLSFDQYGNPTETIMYVSVNLANKPTPQKLDLIASSMKNSISAKLKVPIEQIGFIEGI